MKIDDGDDDDDDDDDDNDDDDVSDSDKGVSFELTCCFVAFYLKPRH